MTKIIDTMAARSGRMRKEDDTVVNQADMLEAIYNALVVNKDAGVALSGSNLSEQLTNSDAIGNVLTFSEPITAIEIFHESASWQEFIVNGITITVPAGGYRTPVGGTPSVEVIIPTGISCIVGRLI